MSTLEAQLHPTHTDTPSFLPSFLPSLLPSFPPSLQCLTHSGARDTTHAFHSRLLSNVRSVRLSPPPTPVRPSPLCRHASFTRRPTHVSFCVVVSSSSVGSGNGTCGLGERLRLFPGRWLRERFCARSRAGCVGGAIASFWSIACTFYSSLVFTTFLCVGC